jgi:WD40 repeat protein
VAGLVATVAVLLVANAIGSTAAAIRLRQSLSRVQRADAQRTEQLWEAELARARADRFSHRVGQRFESLAALRRAAALRVFPDRRREMRDEAIACLALSDLGSARSLGVSKGPDNFWLAFDATFEHFAYSDREGAITVRRVADGAVVARRPSPGRRPQDVRLSFSPDGRWFIVHYSWSMPKNLGPILAWEFGEGEAGRVVTLAEADADLCGFGPDGRTAVLSRSDDAVVFVDLATGREQRRVKLDLEPGRRLFQSRSRISPDGRQIAVGFSGNLSADLFDLKTGARVHRFQLPGPYFDLAWSGDGQLLAVACDDRQIHVWEVASRRLISVLEGHVGAGIEVAFSHGGDFLVSRSWDGTTRLWDPIRGRERLSVNDFFLALSGDDRWMALLSRAGQVEIREIAAGRECRSLYHGRIGNRSPRSAYLVGEVDFRSDGRVLASAGDAGVRLWDLASFAEVVYPPIGTCCTARFGPDGARLLTYGTAGLHLWPIRAEADAGGGGLRVGPPGVGNLPKFNGTAYASWDGKGRLAAVPYPPTGQAVLLDAATLGEIARFGPHPGLRYAMLSPDGRWLATSTWNGSNVKVWDVDRRTPAWELPCGSAAVGFSPDGRWLMTALDHEYRLWHAGSWRPGLTIRSDNGINGPFAFAPDGGLLAVNRGGLVLLVDPDSGWEFATLEPPPEAARVLGWLAFSPDGGRLAVTTDTEVRVWDLRRIRAQLAEMGLDWDAPPLSTPDPADAAAPPLRVRLELDAPPLDSRRDAAPAVADGSTVELPADVFAPP